MPGRGANIALPVSSTTSSSLLASVTARGAGVTARSSFSFCGEAATFGGEGATFGGEAAVSAVDSTATVDVADLAISASASASAASRSRCLRRSSRAAAARFRLSSFSRSCLSRIAAPSTSTRLFSLRKSDSTAPSSHFRPCAMFGSVAPLALHSTTWKRTSATDGSLSASASAALLAAPSRSCLLAKMRSGLPDM